MSDSNGPVRRRRIAGESSPAAPPAKAVPQRPAAKKPRTVKKATGKKDVDKTPTAKTPTAKTPTDKTPVQKRAPRKAADKPAPDQAVAPAPVSKKATPAKAPVRPTPRATPASKPVEPVGPREEDTSKAERPAGSRPSRRDLLWVVPASLAAIVALVMGVYLVINPPGQADSGAELDSSRRQASSAAAGAAETIFTFRYDQLDDHLTASKALMTPAFAKEFDKIAPALTELAPQRNIVVQAVSRESAVLPCGDECSSTKADVLVFVDQARLIGDSKEPTVFANRIKVSMVKGDEGWLVSNIRAL